jgi:branched-chain amino acid aminotransferase
MTSDRILAPPEHVWVDGRLLPASGPHLSVFDRGFQLGDGVFETLRAVAGRPVELEGHLERLRASADGLSIPLPEDLPGRLGPAIEALLSAEGLDGQGTVAAVRVTISRGAPLSRALLPVDGAPPTIVVQAWPSPPLEPGRFDQGIGLIVSSIRHDPESPLATLKLISRADHVYARLEALRAGADDALFLTPDGYLGEATSANLFLVQGSALRTPSLACGILAGTTRSWILAWAPTVGLGAEEALLTARDLHEADEAFLSSSVAGIVPVVRFEGRPVADGRPGPWTRRARAEREAALQVEVDQGSVAARQADAAGRRESAQGRASDLGGPSSSAGS